MAGEFPSVLIHDVVAKDPGRYERDSQAVKNIILNSQQPNT